MRYLLVGGVAVILYGSTRVTQDVDVIPEPTPKNHAWLASALTAWARG